MYYWSVLSKMKTYLCQRSYSLQNTKWSQISSHFSSFLRNLQHTLIVNSRISVVLFIPTHSSCPETWILWQSDSLRPLNAVHSKLSSSIASIVTGVLDVGYVQSLTVIFHLNSLYEYHHAPMTTIRIPFIFPMLRLNHDDFRNYFL